MKDATTVNYLDELGKTNAPKNIDYLQIDLEVSNESTIKTLENLNSQVMEEYKFAVVTFEHDIYTGNHFNTRNRSRAIFSSRGYVRLFSDVKNSNSPYEDWYVHPDLVSQEFIDKYKNDKSHEYSEIIGILNK